MSWVPTYGNWGGPGYSGGRRSRKKISRHDQTLARPIDAADEAFMEHDFAYDNEDYLAGDKRLVQSLDRLDPSVMTYPWLAKHVFRVMSKARELGILDPGIEPNPGPRGRLKTRLAHLPTTNIEGDVNQTTPAFPNQIPFASFTASGTGGYSNPWNQGSGGERSYGANQANTTRAINVNRALPFDVVVVDGLSQFAPIISRPKAIRLEFLHDFGCNALAVDTQFRYYLYRNGVGVVSTRTIDVAAGNNQYNHQLIWDILTQPGDSYSVGVRQYPVGGAASITLTSLAVAYTFLIMGDAIGTYTGGLWMPFTKQQTGEAEGFVADKPRVTQRWPDPLMPEEALEPAEDLPAQDSESDSDTESEPDMDRIFEKLKDRLTKAGLK